MAIEKGATNKPAVDRPQDEEMVQVSRADLKKLMDRVETLEKGRADEGEAVEEVQEHEVRVRFYEGRPISQIVNPRRAGRDEVTGDETMACDLVVIDEDGKPEEVKGVDYLKLIREGEEVVARLLETKTTPANVNQGKVLVMRVDNYSMVSTGHRVPLIVKQTIPTFVVELPGGRQVELKSVNL